MDPDAAAGAQAEYARLRALLDLRLGELRAALDAYETVRPNGDPAGSVAQPEPMRAMVLCGGAENAVMRHRTERHH
jgi:hypothetical protein